MSNLEDKSKNRAVWGLTGGIASGKSTAARIFQQDIGIPVVDADQIARDLSRPEGLAHAAIIKRFGTDDRVKLRQIVFNDPFARKDLEAILHPLIQQESLERISKIPPKIPVLYEAALLVETGRYQNLSGLIVIDCPVPIRRQRLIQRDGATPELADRILAAQISDEDRLKAATQIIQNSGSLEDLRLQIHNFAQKMGWR